mmetsp:Transcript_58799/g.140164  ORF Transcript_58799/g.140164 Transcript_58799/m.140164 type:complete len:334 (-) Transcript_58799:1616-2617(-)
MSPPGRTASMSKQSSSTRYSSPRSSPNLLSTITSFTSSRMMCDSDCPATTVASVSCSCEMTPSLSESRILKSLSETAFNAGLGSTWRFEPPRKRADLGAVSTGRLLGGIRALSSLAAAALAASTLSKRSRLACSMRECRSSTCSLADRTLSDLFANISSRRSLARSTRTICSNFRCSATFSSSLSRACSFAIRSARRRCFSSRASSSCHARASCCSRRLLASAPGMGYRSSKLGIERDGAMLAGCSTKVAAGMCPTKVPCPDMPEAVFGTEPMSMSSKGAGASSPNSAPATGPTCELRLAHLADSSLAACRAVEITWEVSSSDACSSRESRCS